MAETETKIKKPTLCQQKQTSYIVTYEEALAFAQMQFSIAWPPEEIPVENDIQEFKTIAYDSDKHAITTSLKLFTKYELFAGHEYWGNRIANKYPRVCIQRMANAFAFAELNMHAPFYNELNKALNLDTEEFYSSYIEDPVLKARMEHVEEIIKSDDDLLSLGAFSMVEGAVLYSAFAFFKHYQVHGKNLFKNLVSGINFSVRDENLHADGGAWLFSLHKSELIKSDQWSEQEEIDLEKKLRKVANKIYEHECKIIDMLFEKGPIKGITPTQLKNFVQSRLNMCLKKLGYTHEWKISYNPIEEWFYDNINAIKLHDFFNTTGNEYNRNWNMEAFDASW